eukprot:RCo036622
MATLLASGTPKPGGSPKPGKPLQDTDVPLSLVALQWIGARNSHSAATVAQMFAPGATYWDPEVGVVSKPGISAVIARFVQRFPNHRFEMRSPQPFESINHGNTKGVAVPWVMSGSKWGVSFQLAGCDILTAEITSGRLTEALVYFDRVSVWTRVLTQWARRLAWGLAGSAFIAGLLTFLLE